MNLKPQDVLVLLKLIALGDRQWIYSGLAIALGMSSSEVHSAVKRVLASGLAVQIEDRILPDTRNLKEFLLHGLRYVFPPERGQYCRGMPTAYAAPPLMQKTNSEHETPVWPDPDGKVRGTAFTPLYKSAPVAARQDPLLYELLALVDAIRGGRAREREMAKMALGKHLAGYSRENSLMQAQDKNEIVIGDEIAVNRDAIQEIAKRYHIQRIYLFGSAARGELRPDSDIDLLIEFEEKKAPSLGSLVNIQDAFAKLFSGRKVDIATSSILQNPYRKHAIERDMEELYAA